MFLSHHCLRRPMLRLVDHVGLARMYIDCLVCLACFVGTSDSLKCSWARDGWRNVLRLAAKRR